MNLIKKVVLALLMLMPVLGWAGEYTCLNNGHSVCKYSGNVEKAYINEDDVVIIYFEAAVSSTEKDSAGYTCMGDARTHRSAGRLDITQDNEIFGKQLYASALSAAIAGKEVIVMMTKNRCLGSYPQIDRIWVERN